MFKKIEKGCIKIKIFFKNRRKNEIKNEIIWNKVSNNKYNFKKYKHKIYINNIILKIPIMFRLEQRQN